MAEAIHACNYYDSTGKGQSRYSSVKTMHQVPDSQLCTVQINVGSVGSM